jgi:MarR family transcriptional regulator, organic hydroperoxide resistance regulator
MDGKNTKNAKLINEIITLQQESNRILGKFSAEPWIDLSLTIAQLKCLFFIDAKEKTNFKKLSDALGVTPPNITGIVDRLVGDGLISRTENPEDRRINYLQTTIKGRTLVSNLRDHNNHQINHILDQMSYEDLASLAQGLNALVKAALSSHQQDM